MKRELKPQKVLSTGACGSYLIQPYCKMRKLRPRAQVETQKVANFSMPPNQRIKVPAVFIT